VKAADLEGNREVSVMKMQDSKAPPHASHCSGG